jgi:hypothetical protein
MLGPASSLARFFSGNGAAICGVIKSPPGLCPWQKQSFWTPDAGFFGGLARRRGPHYTSLRGQAAPGAKML